MTDRRLRAVVAALSAIGVGIAGYLTYVHYAGLMPVCGISHGCETVQTSRYALLDGVPVAPLGLLAYIIVLASAGIRGEQVLLTGFGVSLVAVSFSAYLTYREVFTIHAICSWCISSAIVFALVALTNSIRFASRPDAALQAGAWRDPAPTD